MFTLTADDCITDAEAQARHARGVSDCHSPHLWQPEGERAPMHPQSLCLNALHAGDVDKYAAVTVGRTSALVDALAAEDPEEFTAERIRWTFLVLAPVVQRQILP